MKFLFKEQNKTILFTSTLIVLSFLLFCRCIANYFVPLNDVTEARYGEIARKMLETGNWVTLQHEYGVPFWAKPPLSSWLSALSMRCFGVNEFAARLPSLLLSIGVLWLVWDIAKKHSGALTANIAVLVLASSLYFFLDAGAVMTDPALLFCTTLAAVAFWHAFTELNRQWAYVFFIALGLGLLAKGPIALILAGLPVFFLMLLRGQWLALWQRLPWIKGSLLLLLVALPWYILAEKRTPGFLHYFILGEHINRFLVPGWTGDKYGMAHDAAKGMIWLYASNGIFPWSILGLVWLARYGKRLPALCKDADGWTAYLLCWMLTPLLFFSFANNIIYPYVFPFLPAFALFFAEIAQRVSLSPAGFRFITRLSLLCGGIFLAATLLFIVKPELVAKTQKPLINVWKQQHPPDNEPLIYWDYRTEFSAQYYANGKVRATSNAEELRRWLTPDTPHYLAVYARIQGSIPADVLARMQLIYTMKRNKNTLSLFKINP